MKERSYSVFSLRSDSRAAFEFISRTNINDPRRQSRMIDLRTVTLPPENTEDDDIGFDPRQHRSPKVVLSRVWMAYFNLLRSMFGAGVLAMPLAISQAGILTGPALTLLFIIILNYTHHMLLWSLNEVSRRLQIPYISYRYGFRIALMNGPRCMQFIGRCGAQIIAIFMFLSQIGICGVFLVFIADSIRDLMDLESTRDIMAAMFLPAVALVFFMKNLKIIGYISMMGNLFMLLGMLITFKFIFTGAKYDEQVLSSDNIVQIMFAIGIILFNHSAIGVILAIDKALPNPYLLIKPFGILNVGMITPAIVGMIFGLLGYWKFGSMDENVLRSLPFDDVEAELAFVLYSIAIALSYPIQCFPGTEIMLEVYKAATENRQMWCELQYVEYVLRVFFVLLTFVVIGCVPFQGPFVAFVGSLCTSQLTLVFPAMMELCLKYPGKFGIYKYHLIKDIFLILLGTFVSVGGVAMSGYIISLRILYAGD